MLGDIKLENILVNPQGMPSIIDIDSFQVTHPSTGDIYRCLVGSEGFTPPELFGQDFASVNQKPKHDRFRLAVVIYYLLFGEHPFQGKWVGSGEAPDKNRLVQQGIWPYAPHDRRKLHPSARTIPLEILHPEVKDAFLRCFNDGHRNPSQRSTAQEWFQALETAVKDLQQCSNNDSHWYYQGSTYYQ